MTRAVAHAWTEPPASWAELVRDDPNATAAHRPEVWRALAATLPGMTPAFVGVERDGRLLGGAGLLIERRAGFHWLHALPFLLPGAPLARAGAHEEVDLAVGERIGCMQRALGAVGGEWVLHRPAGPAVGAAAAGSVAGETRMQATWFVHLTAGAPAMWNALDRNTRHAVRRARARGLRVTEDPAAIEEAYALHLAQARAWPGVRPLPLALSRRLLAAPRDGNGPVARLMTVRDARRCVAAVLLLDHPREQFAWWSGMGDTGRASGAMSLLFWELIERASGEGRSRLNFGGGAGRESLAAYKRRFGALERTDPVRWLDARHAPWPARIMGAAQTWWRRGRPRGGAA